MFKHLMMKEVADLELLMYIMVWYLHLRLEALRA